MRLSSCCESFVLAGPETGLQAVSIHMLICSIFLFNCKTIVLWLYWGKIQTIKRRTIEINPVTIGGNENVKPEYRKEKDQSHNCPTEANFIKYYQEGGPWPGPYPGFQRNGTELGQSVAYKAYTRLHTVYLRPVGAVPSVGYSVTVLRKQWYIYQQPIVKISSQEICCSCET